MAAVLTLLYQRKLLTNYQVCILLCRYFVGISCIHVPLLHMLQMLQHYIANSVTLRTRQHLLHSLLSGTFKPLLTKEIHCKMEENGQFLLYSFQIGNISESLIYGYYLHHYAIKLFLKTSYDISWNLCLCVCSGKLRVPCHMILLIN